MWLGQNSPSLFEQHFFKLKKDGAYDISHQEIQDVPAKLKCLDEACMNAIDEYNRNLIDRKIPSSRKMTTLWVSLSQKGRRVKVVDNGRGIPSKNAEQVFLHLMYGENFDDQARKEHITGQNGVGISLVRIVSKYFKVQTSHQGESFSKLFTISDTFKEACEKLKIPSSLQEKLFLHFDENGSIKNFSKLEGKLISQLQKTVKSNGMGTTTKQVDKNEHGTSIEFELDPKYFSNENTSFNEKYTAQYLQDLAMINPGLEIVLETEKDKQVFFFKKGLEDIFKNTPQPYYHLKFQTPKKDFTLSSILVGEEGKTLSWVNSNFVSLGGSAIEYLVNRVCDETRRKPTIVAYEKRLKTSATRNDVRACFHMYNNFRLSAPRFKSQDKSYLINDLKQEIREVIDTHLDKIIKRLGLVNKIKEEMSRRVKIKDIDSAQKDLKKTSFTSIPKFIPCTPTSSNEIKTLFIGEGDSAIAGLRPVRQPTIHGLFPLRGKPLNVKGLSLSKALANEELKNIVSILKLPFSDKIQNPKDLTFDRIAIMTDADYDGYSIRSLILSFFFEYWPELFSFNMIYMVEAPLYEVELENPDKKKRVFYCIDDNEYDVLISKAKKSDCQLIRKKRNKGLGETSREGMSYAIMNGLICIGVKDIKQCRKTQDIWFHKDKAHLRRKEISDYVSLFFDE
ncbi:DNA gyrase subunit B-like [Ylistrum balloti]|uniref:DNA gyrase subunit B-like n=1 Tax=Ylistrum balloti TaxID=509963 RepID=UPI0029058EE4|nr:DNA gyrase subunit B-like [Ylistrum balloti]